MMIYANIPKKISIKDPWKSYFKEGRCSFDEESLVGFG